MKSCITLAVSLGLASCADKGTELPSAVPATRVTLGVETPDAGWRLRVERILERADDVWILARLERPPGPAAQVISQAQTILPIVLPNKPFRVFVVGKTWGWPNAEPYEFIVSADEMPRHAGGGRMLYNADAQE